MTQDNTVRSSQATINEQSVRRVWAEIVTAIQTTAATVADSEIVGETEPLREGSAIGRFSLLLNSPAANLVGVNVSYTGNSYGRDPFTFDITRFRIVVNAFMGMSTGHNWSTRQIGYPFKADGTVNLPKIVERIRQSVADRIEFTHREDARRVARDARTIKYNHMLGVLRDGLGSGLDPATNSLRPVLDKDRKIDTALVGLDGSRVNISVDAVPGEGYNLSIQATSIPRMFGTGGFAELVETVIEGLKAAGLKSRKKLRLWYRTADVQEGIHTDDLSGQWKYSPSDAERFCSECHRIIGEKRTAYISPGSVLCSHCVTTQPLPPVVNGMIYRCCECHMGINNEDGTVSHWRASTDEDWGVMARILGAEVSDGQCNGCVEKQREELKSQD